MDTHLCLENDGQKLVRTNFWEAAHNAKGNFFLSTNAGAMRLIVPDCQRHVVDEIRYVDTVYVTRGPHYMDPSEIGIELLFEDESPMPYVLQMHVSDLDRLFPKSEAGQKIPFTVWVNGKRGKAKQVLSMRAHLGFASSQLPTIETPPTEAATTGSDSIPEKVLSFEHYTLQTGHTYQSPRQECPDIALETIRPILSQARFSGSYVPAFTEGNEQLYLMENPLDASFAVSTAYASKVGESEVVPLAIWITNWNKTTEDKAWQTTLKLIDMVTSDAQSDASAIECFTIPVLAPLQKPKTSPWCAVCLMPHMARFPKLLPMLGDFERVVTWAQLESAGLDIIR